MGELENREQGEHVLPGQEIQEGSSHPGHHLGRGLEHQVPWVVPKHLLVQSHVADNRLEEEPEVNFR